LISQSVVGQFTPLTW